MKLQIFSDLHLEFFPNQLLIEEFLNKLIHPNIDVLILAGDISISVNIPSIAEFLSTKYKDIIFVPGNHEYYSTYPRQAAVEFSRIVPKNFHVLLNSGIVLNGVSFLGTTLWFKDVHNPKTNRLLSDFFCISEFIPWVYEENEKAIEFLNKNVGKGKVIITHHVPTFRSIPIQYTNSNLNPYFVCPLDDLIRKKQPKCWIHGHSHFSFDYQYSENTRILCNPFGYYKREENPNFDYNGMIIYV